MCSHTDKPVSLLRGALLLGQWCRGLWFHCILSPKQNLVTCKESLLAHSMCYRSVVRLGSWRMGNWWKRKDISFCHFGVYISHRRIFFPLWPFPSAWMVFSGSSISSPGVVWMTPVMEIHYFFREIILLLYNVNSYKYFPYNEPKYASLVHPST